MTRRLRRLLKVLANEMTSSATADSVRQPGFLVGVVRDDGGITHVAVHTRAAGLAEKLAAYAWHQAGQRCGPEVERQVREQLDRGEVDGAVRTYFEEAGLARDGEWLSVLRLGPSGIAPADIIFPGAKAGS